MKLTPNINKVLRSHPKAPLGDRNINECPDDLLHLQKVVFTDDAYGPDGTYWGAPANLWCAFNGENEEYGAAMGTRIYVRAESREIAAELICQDYGVRFKREKA